MSSFFSSDTMSMPDDPDYSQAISDVLSSWISSQDSLYDAESTYAPLYNSLYNSLYSDSMSAYNDTYQSEVLQGLSDYANQYASSVLSYSQEYDPQFIAQQLANAQQADPEYWAIREAYGDQVLSDLALGNTLSDSQQRSVEQSIRASTAQTGASQYGYAPAAQEVLGEFLAGEDLYTQRQDAALSFLSNGAYTPETLSADSGVTGDTFDSFTDYMTSTGSDLTSSAVSGAQSTYDSQVDYATNYNNNQVSPFSTLVSSVGTLGSAAGSFFSFA